MKKENKLKFKVFDVIMDKQEKKDIAVILEIIPEITRREKHYKLLWIGKDDPPGLIEEYTMFYIDNFFKLYND